MPKYFGFGSDTGFAFTDPTGVSFDKWVQRIIKTGQQERAIIRSIDASFYTADASAAFAILYVLKYPSGVEPDLEVFAPDGNNVILLNQQGIISLLDLFTFQSQPLHLKFSDELSCENGESLVVGISAAEHTTVATAISCQPRLAVNGVMASANLAVKLR